MHITSDYDHNIPLAKKVCPGTDDDYNSIKNIAIAHVELGLICHYHIDINWRRNVTYEHSRNGKTYTYTPEQEINYLYRKYWKEPDYKKDASIEDMMQYLVKKGIYDPMACCYVFHESLRAEI